MRELDGMVARVPRLALGRDRIEIGRVGGVGDRRAFTARLIDQLAEQKFRSCAAIERQD